MIGLMAADTCLCGFLDWRRSNTYTGFQAAMWPESIGQW